MIKRISSIVLYVLFLFLCFIALDKIYARYEKVQFRHCKVNLFTWGHGRHAFKVSDIPGLGWEMVPGSKVKYLETNSTGIRGREYQVSKPRNKIRILILGDSVSHGKFIEEKDVFSVLLEDKLNKDSHDMTYEVINTSVPGYNTIQEYIAFVNKWRIYKPDLLLTCFNPSDLTPTLLQIDDRNGLIYPFLNYDSGNKSGPFKIKDMPYNEMLSISMPDIFMLPPSIHRKMMLNSSLYRLITVKIYDFLSRRNKYKYPPQAYLSFVEDQAGYAIDQLKAYCKNNNIGLIFVLFPYLYDDTPTYPGDEIKVARAKEALESKSITYIDLLPLYRAKLDKPTELALDPEAGDYTHLNVKGHRLTAEVIYGYLTEYFKNKKYAEQ